MKHFSDREEKIINIIGSKELGFSEITEELFKDSKFVPFDSIISVGNSIRRIIRKCIHFDLDWTLGKFKKDSKIVIKKIKL